MDVRVNGDHMPFTPFPSLEGERVQAEPGTAEHPAVTAFIAELRHWREAAGCSQKALAKAVRFSPSYVNKVEHGTVHASRPFAEAADAHLGAGRALIRRWKEMHEALVELSGGSARAGDSAVDDVQLALGHELVVENEIAELTYQDGVYQSRIRRQLRNAGDQPVTQYLIRIAVDRYPGDPERSNRLYREDPLTWEEIGLSAACDDEPMTWRVKHDRDAFKEVWLLFENQDGRFPLYPGETAWISYTYSVTSRKWGPWWARAIRLPTHRLSMTLTFPARLQPVVWGIMTTMAAEASPFPTPIARHQKDDQVVFTWSTEDPPLRGGYRIEWKFKAPEEGEKTDVGTMSPAEQMRSLDIVQEGDPVLAEVARPFDLPAEAEDARRVVAQLVSTLERVGQVHNFTKGMGLAAPQIGISRAAAVVRTPGGETVTLLNPRICDESTDTDEQYEGCLSFFDVRGMVPRPLAIEVEHQDTDGTMRITAFDRGMARLVCHEVDHLSGVLYRARMRPGIEPIPVAKYRGIGQQWTYR
jgi:peptide deformylase